MLDVTVILLGFALVGIAASAFVTWLPLTVAILAVSILEGHFLQAISYVSGDSKIAIIDVLSVTAAVAGTLRIVARQRLTGLGVLWCLAIALMFLAFLRGADSYGFAAAAIFYRKLFYLSAFGLYLLSFPMTARDLDNVCRLWLAVAVALSAATVAMWAMPELMPEELLESIGNNWGFDLLRVLPASSALLIAEGALICGCGRLVGAGITRAVLTLGLLAIVLVLAHRSVWAATLAGAVLLVGLRIDRALRVGGLAAAGAVVMIGAWLAVRAITGIDSVAEPLGAAFEEPFSDQSSIAWRAAGWEILLARVLGGGPLSVLFGGGFGVGYERLIGFEVVQVSPHSMYVEMLVNAGLIAVAAWLAFHVAALWLARRRWDDDASTLSGRVAAALLVATLVFGISYSLPVEQGLLIAALGHACVLSGARRIARPVASPASA